MIQAIQSMGLVYLPTFAKFCLQIVGIYGPAFPGTPITTRLNPMGHINQQVIAVEELQTARFKLRGRD